MADVEQNIGFHNGDFNQKLFTEVVRNISPEAECVDFQQVPFSTEGGYVSSASSDSCDDQRFVGFRAFVVTYKDNAADSCVKSCHVLFKVRTKGLDVRKSFVDLLRTLHGEAAADAYHQMGYDTFIDTELREMACVNVTDPTWRALMPEVYWSKQDDERQIYAFAMEDLRYSKVTYMDAVNDVKCWGKDDITCVLRNVASFHALYYGKTDMLPEAIKHGLVNTASLTHFYIDTNMIAFTGRWVNEYHKVFPQVFTEHINAMLNKSLAHAGKVCAILDDAPQSLVHNDFNVRNVCLRQEPVPRGKSKVCIYDWELIRVANPQHDVVEFLAFVLPEDSKPEAWAPYVEEYRQELLKELKRHEASDDVMASLHDKEQFQQVFDMCVLEYAWFRFGIYMLLSPALPDAAYVPRLVGNFVRYVEAMAERYEFLA